MTYTGELAASGGYISLISSTTGPQREHSDLDYFNFPCNGNAPAAVNNYGTGQQATGQSRITVDTTRLHRQVDDADSASSTEDEIIYAVCYQESSGPVWADSAIRLTLTQVQQILYRSGYDRGEASSSLALTALTLAVNDGGTTSANGAAGCSASHGMGSLCDYFDNVWGIDAKKDTMARHITSSYSVKNRLPLHENGSPAV
jgi:hypothetical protein